MQLMMNNLLLGSTNSNSDPCRLQSKVNPKTTRYLGELDLNFFLDQLQPTLNLQYTGLLLNHLNGAKTESSSSNL